MPRTLALTCALVGGLLGLQMIAATPAHADEGDTNYFCAQGYTEGGAIGNWQTGNYCIWGLPLTYSCTWHQGAQVFDDNGAYVDWCFPKII